MRKLHSLLIAGSVAGLAVPLAASPAAAAEAASSCYVQAGSIGTNPNAGRAVGSWNWSSGNSLTSVHLEASDLRADGYTPAVRLVTKQRDGDVHYWALHKATGGAGTTLSWNTSATDTQGIASAWVQGELLSGNSLVGLCYGDTKVNPD
ncbi:hypothetical protein [Streptomyces sp. NPDC049915]|uniref:hypothetical protein n=1 Tax=Streptomyces sp. NPDC049915 TaxID=3155510 RepID=UPI003444B7B2